MKIQIGNIRNQWTWCPSAGQRRRERSCHRRDGLDADGNLFRDVRGGLSADVIGLLGIILRTEQLVLIVQESSGCCIKLRRVQIFIRFSTEILNGGTIKSVGGNGRFVDLESGKITA